MEPSESTYIPDCASTPRDVAIEVLWTRDEDLLQGSALQSFTRKRRIRMVQESHIRGHNLRDRSHGLGADRSYHFWWNDVCVHDPWQHRVDRNVLFLQYNCQHAFLQLVSIIAKVHTIRNTRPVARTKFRTAAFAPSYSG